MADRVYNVLFLCTGNSARSIMAEVVLRKLGQGRFNAFSAGSHPAGSVHPLAIETLQRMRLPTEALRCKGWDQFAAPERPRSVSCSRSATRPLARSAPPGPVSR